MESTAGFYKVDGELLYAPNGVLHACYELLPDLKNTYTYPVDGWTWYDSEEAARKATDTL
jgi:hypothetical protein